MALKTLRLGGDLPPDKRAQRIEQLVREAVTAARFSHPNVVAVYDVEDAPEGAYIAMELVEGVSLERLLLHRGRLRPEEVIPLGAAIARGLAAAHARDIVHRDVKPANVHARPRRLDQGDRLRHRRPDRRVGPGGGAGLRHARATSPPRPCGGAATTAPATSSPSASCSSNPSPASSRSAATTSRT